jgi:hypothetical protein
MRLKQPNNKQIKTSYEAKFLINPMFKDEIEKKIHEKKRKNRHELTQVNLIT